MTTDERLDAFTSELNRERDRIDDAIRDQISTIRSTLDRVERYMDEGSSLNELGELQSRGTELDRLIATRQTVARLQVMADWVKN